MSGSLRKAAQHFEVQPIPPPNLYQGAAKLLRRIADDLELRSEQENGRVALTRTIDSLVRVTRTLRRRHHTGG